MDYTKAAREYVLYLLKEIEKAEYELSKLKSKTAQIKRIAIEEREKAKGGKFFHPFYEIEMIIGGSDTN
jgi:hypothetical protein